MSRLTILMATCLLIGCGAKSNGERIESPTAKRIALSFDDGPRGQGPRFSGAERATQLIAALDGANVAPVVFFVKTKGLLKAEGRERIRRYANAGHLIANHTHTHPWFSKTETSEYLAEIDRAEELLREFPNRRPWFRFPYLDEGRPRDKRDALREGLEQRGLINGYVTIDNYDWYIESKWQDAKNAGLTVDMQALQGAYVDMLVGAVQFYDRVGRQALGYSPAHMLLLHENDVAALFIDDLIAALRADGWTLISPDEVYAGKTAQRTPTTLRTRQGHVAALAVEAGLPPETLTHLAIEEAQLDEFLATRGVFGD